MTNDDCGMPNEERAGGVFIRALGNAVEGRPPMEEMGYRVWIMAARVGAACPPPTAQDRRRMREIAGACNGHLGLGEAAPAVVRDAFEIIIGPEETARGMGRRATLLAYAFNRSASVRAALPSFESIGVLWGLRAKNKRSAVCAAMDKLTGALGRRARHPVELWFRKKEITRRKYEAAQMGNGNRGGGMTNDGDAEKQAAEEIAVVIDGVRVRRKFALMTKVALRAHLRRLAEDDDLRRLAALGNDE